MYLQNKTYIPWLSLPARPKQKVIQACTQKKTLIWNVPNSQRFMNTASEDCKTFKRMEKNEIK